MTFFLETNVLYVLPVTVHPNIIIILMCNIKNKYGNRFKFNIVESWKIKNCKNVLDVASYRANPMKPPRLVCHLCWVFLTFDVSMSFWG